MTMMRELVTGQWSRRKKLIGAAAAAVATAVSASSCHRCSGRSKRRSPPSAALHDLQQLRVRLVHCQPPLKGQLVTYTGLGSGLGARYFSIDLNRNAPVAEYVDAKGAMNSSSFRYALTDCTTARDDWRERRGASPPVAAL
jgi:hypothetical protein